MSIMNDPTLNRWFEEKLRPKIIAETREATLREAAEEQTFFNTIVHVLGHRFATIPLEVTIDLRRVSAAQRSQVLDLALSATDATTFQHQLAELLV